MFEQQNTTVSLGATAILDAFNKLAGSYKSPTWDIFLINIATIIRNNMTKEISDKQIMDGVFEDIDNIAIGVMDYLKQRPHPPENPGLIVYSPNYEALPILHSRELNASNKRIFDIQRHLEQKYMPELEVPSTIKLDQLNCVTIRVGSKKTGYPHRVLYKYIKEQVEKGFLGKVKSILGFNELRVGMISHHALDLHMAEYIKQFTLVESYTGVTKTLSEFGEKVFKKPGIPFNTATHLLFGDSTHIRPIAMRKTKQLILDLAMRSRWMTKNEPTIVSEVAATGWVPRQLLTTIKF